MKKDFSRCLLFLLLLAFPYLSLAQILSDIPYLIGLSLSGTVCPSTSIDASTHNTHALLHMAIQKRSPHLVNRVLACKLDVNQQSEDGWTPLHSAAYYGSPQVIELLVQHGANIHAPASYQNMTPLHIAAKYNRDPAVVQTLLKLGAEPSRLNAEQKTPAQIAHSAQIARLLNSEP